MKKRMKRECGKVSKERRGRENEKKKSNNSERKKIMKVDLEH